MIRETLKTIAVGIAASVLLIIVAFAVHSLLALAEGVA